MSEFDTAPRKPEFEKEPRSESKLAAPESKLAMPEPKLAMLVPSRGRPGSVARMLDAWEQTGGFDHARLVWVLDRDDPEFGAYEAALRGRSSANGGYIAEIARWQPMVTKLNRAARIFARDFPAVGFMGDDHLPRTHGWAAKLHEVLSFRVPNPAIVYGRDGFQDSRLPTWWAMSSSVVTTLGRMVPADVQHLYCDNAIKMLGEQSGCLVYVDSVLIEHMHPVVGKGEIDEGYRRVNRRQQYERDSVQFRRWVQGGLARDVTLLRNIQGG